MKLSFGVKEIADFLAGGIPTGKLICIFGEQNIGKSWMCAQLSFMATRPVNSGGLNTKVLYIDTEQYISEDEDVMPFLTEVFSKRWKDVKPENIELVSAPNIFELGELFGIQYEIMQEKQRISAIAKYPKKKSDKPVKLSLIHI